MRSIIAIMDLQFGSTGKGQIAGTMAHAYSPDTVVTAWGPNAGHTFRYHGDHKMVTTMLASGSIAPSVRNVLIGPGSIVKISNLSDEIQDNRQHLVNKNLYIHPQAAVWHQSHADAERQLLRIGSTMKGTGESLVEKIRRHDMAVMKNNLQAYEALSRVWPGNVIVNEREYDAAIDASSLMMVEGSQGFSLGIHTSFYPYCTSRDISTAQLLADCRIPFPNEQDLEVIGVCRTYPIRVANRTDERGQLVGTSGGSYIDQDEISWKDIGREPELTTVTKLPRRIFKFSHEQIRQACRIIRPDRIALTFCDYLEPVDHGEGDGPRVKLPAAVANLADMIEWSAKFHTAAKVKFFSFGPTINDLYERYSINSDIRPVYVP